MGLGQLAVLESLTFSHNGSEKFDILDPYFSIFSFISDEDMTRGGS